MRSAKLFTVGAFLSATLTAAALADGQWEVLITADGVATVPGLEPAVWVPNQFNNPVIDNEGRVTFRCQIAGPGITTANSRILFTGKPGAYSVVARDGSPVPGGVPSGYVFNTTSGLNGLASSNNLAENGGIPVSGNINGAGNTTLLDTAMFWVPTSGTPSIIVRESDPCPGTAGAIMSSAMTAGSGQQFNSVGQSLFYTSMTGGDTVTANNGAVVLLTTSDDQLIMRKGAAAPGLSGFTVNPDSFGLWLNGSKVLFSGKLVGTGITTANDSIYLTNIGSVDGLRIWAREGDPIPGLKGLTFANTSSLSFTQHPASSDGAILFNATLGGSATTLNNTAIMTEQFGTFTILVRKGDAIPGITDDATNANWTGKVFSSPNTTAFVRNRNGLLAFQGIMMNSDGSGITSPAPATFVGVRSPSGQISTICRQGDSVPGLDPTWTFDSLNGSTSICVSDVGVVVFNANITNATLGEFGNAICAWDATNGFRILGKATQNSTTFASTGDTLFLGGTPCNQLTLIGSTGNNGDGGHTGISSNGWLTLRAGDSNLQKYSICRIFLGQTSTGCPADLNGNGNVGAEDLATLLAAWGGTGGDLNADGVTNAADMAILLSSWGACQ